VRAERHSRPKDLHTCKHTRTRACIRYHQASWKRQIPLANSLLINLSCCSGWAGSLARPAGSWTITALGKILLSCACDDCPTTLLCFPCPLCPWPCVGGGETQEDAPQRKAPPIPPTHVLGLRVGAGRKQRNDHGGVSSERRRVQGGALVLRNRRRERARAPCMVCVRVNRVSLRMCVRAKGGR
jgi:hypothetical protein